MEQLVAENIKNVEEFFSIKSPEELLEFMKKNIRYGIMADDYSLHLAEDKDFDSIWKNHGVVQTGEQVAKTLCGTCWDQVELERKWFSDNGYNIKTFFIWYELEIDNDLPTHTFLAYEKGDSWVWFENAAGPTISEFEDLNELIAYIKDRQQEYAEKLQTKTTPYRNDIKVYEYPAIDETLPIEEYIKFVTKSENKI